MDTNWSRLLRRAPRTERGAARTLVMAGIAAAGSLGTLVAIDPGAQVEAAEQVACAYERRVLLTAIETDRAMGDDYAAPAGADGFDEIRSSGFLATEAQYWVYAGLDDEHRPVLVARTAEECDTGAADRVAEQLGGLAGSDGSDGSGDSSTTTVAPTTAVPATGVAAPTAG